MKKRLTRFLSILTVLCLTVTLMLPSTAFAADKKRGQGEVKYYITVDQTNQIVTVFRISDGAIVRQMLCSAGLNGATPNHTYSMPKNETDMDRTEWYHFKGFRCYAKYPTRIFKGILFHSITYNKNTEDSMSKSAIEAYGHADSHGCIRLLVEDSKWIQENCMIGTKVIIYESGIKDQNLWNILFQEHYTEESGMTYQEFLGGAVTRYSSTDDVYALQYRLHELGYYNGEVNGVWGEDTSTALIYAQLMTGSEISGNVSSEFMDLINSSDATVVPGYDFNDCMHDPGIRLVQKNLKTMGLYSGDIDGIFDYDVSEAVAKFESCYGYEQTGVPTVIEQEAMQYEADQILENCGSDATAELVNETVNTATVNYDKSIRMRAEPDTDSDEVKTVKNGTVLILLEKGDTWSKVQDGSSVGYMKNKYLEFGAYTFCYIKCSGSKGDYTIGCTVEQLQSGKEQPNVAFETYYEALVEDRKEKVKDAIETANNAGGEYGTTTTTTMVVNTGSDDITLNLRESPSTDANVLDVLANGTEVSVNSQSDGWYEVNVNGATGYVVSQYLEAKPAHTDLMQGNPTAATVTTEEGFAYVYTDADKKSTKIGYVTTGSSVSAYGTGDGFTYICYTDRNQNVCYGFVKTEMLTGAVVDLSAAETVNDDNVEDEELFAYVIDSVGSAPVCSEASDSGTILATVPSGTKLTVLEADDDSQWVKVQYNGTEGYIQNSMLRFDNE